MGTIRKGRSEREELKRITDEYLESIQHKLTPRDVKILELLAFHPLLNSYHVFTLTEGVDGISPFYPLAKGRQLCNNRLRVLFDCHLIHKESPLLAPGMGTSKQYVWLDRGGIRLLGLNREHRSKLPADYLHTSLIMDVICRFTEWHREGKIEVFVLKREVAQTSWPLIPDVVVLFRYKGKGYLYVVEVDRSEKREKDEQNKIQSYRDWMLSAAWLQESWAKILPKPRFPYVLYLFDETKSSWRRRQTKFKEWAAIQHLPFRSMGIGEFLEGFLESLG